MNDRHFDRYDVAIVGYGPVGQALSLNLGQLGHKVVFFERHSGLYGRARAGHIDGEIMRYFQGLGIAEVVEPLMSPVHRYELVDRNFNVLHTVDFGAYGCGWQSDYLFYQPDMEDALHEAVTANDNVTLHQNHEAVSVSQTADGVTISARDRDSGEITSAAAH